MGRHKHSKWGKGYGWRPDLPNRTQSAKKYSLFHAFLQHVPSSVDLRTSPNRPAIYDQGQLGSCVGNGTARVVQFAQPSLGNPSRLYIYYNARDIEGDTDEDAGAQIHDGVQGVVQKGIIPETEWPYDISTFANTPTEQMYADGLKDLVTDYFSLNGNDEIKQCLAAGFPVVFGMSVYESFESDSTAATGIVTMPHSNEQQVGGHCMVIVGYDDAKKWWIVDNSWGPGWGDKGSCYIPYAYIDQFASDFWTVRKSTAQVVGGRDEAHQ